VADRTIVLATNKRHAVRGLTVVNPQEFSAYQEDNDDLTYIVDMSSYLDGATISSVTRTPTGVTVSNTSNTTTRLTQRLKGFGFVDFKVTTSSGDIEEFRIKIQPRAGSAFFLPSIASVPQNSAQFFPTPAQAAQSSPGDGINYIWVSGDDSAGDGKDAVYRRTTSAVYPDTFTTQNGVIFERVPARRTVLNANTTYYVRTDGSDSNAGLANTSGGAFLTIQKAIDVVAETIDTAGYTVTIQVGAGTYTGANVITGQFFGAGAVVIQGDTTTPSNVVVSVTSGHCFRATAGTYVTITGFKVQTTTSGLGLVAEYGSTMIVGVMDFGACVTGHWYAAQSGTMLCLSNYTISGGGAYHWHSDSTGCLIYVTSNTITITGTPAFSAFFAGVSEGKIKCPSITFSGPATGPRFLAHFLGVIDTGSESLTYLPGSTAGSILDGGLYIGSQTYMGAQFGNTGLRLLDTDSSHYLTIAPGSNLTAARTLTLTTGDADRTLDVAAVVTTSASNTFTAQQVVTVTTAGGSVIIAESTDAGAVAGPLLTVRRASASPAANDQIGSFLFQGRDTAAVNTQYASLGATISDPTDGSEDGRLDFNVINAGTLASRMWISQGVVVGSPTGGDRGAGTLNAVAVYDDSVLLCAPVEFMKSGTVNTAMWDGYAIDVVEPEVVNDELVEIDVQLTEPEEQTVRQRDGSFKRVKVTSKKATPLDAIPVLDDKGEQVGIEWVPQTVRKVKPARTIKRRNELAHEFKAMLDQGFDPRDPKAYFDKMLADEALPGLKTKANWVPNQESNATRTNRIILALELQTAAFKTVYEQVEALKAEIENLKKQKAQ
jgi:hypothetical protein